MKLLFFIFLASSCAALANFFFRKNTCANGNQSAYLSAQYLFSFLTSLLLFESFTDLSFSFPMLGIGMIVGGMNVLLMFCTSQALQRGPTGAIFAFQNAGAVFPGVLLFFCFGTEYGYTLTLFQILGMLLVIGGLCCFAKKSPSSKEGEDSLKWIPYAIICFFVQVFALTCIQWRCLLFCEEATHFFIPFTLREADDIWFLPGFFGSAFILQSLGLFFEKRPIHLQDAAYGLAGGIANGAATALLVLVTKWALPEEQAMLFPCFAVMVIVLCSAWARWVYRERFDFLSNAVCSAGIMIGKL